MSTWSDSKIEIPDYLENIEELKAYADTLQEEFYQMRSVFERMADSAILNNVLLDSDRWGTILDKGMWDVFEMGSKGICELFMQDKTVTLESLKKAAVRESKDDDAEVEYDRNSMTVTIRVRVLTDFDMFCERMREYVPCNLIVKIEKIT